MIKKNTMIIVLAIMIAVMSVGLLITKENALDNENKIKGNNAEIKEDEEIEEKEELEVEEQSSPKEETTPTTSEKEEVEGNSKDDEASSEDNTSSNSPKEETTTPSVPKEETQVTKKITIDNRCQSTAQALEKIYQDNNYEYYLNSISSGCIYVTVNSKEYTLKTAINNDIVTVYELEENGFTFYKKSRNLVSR